MNSDKELYAKLKSNLISNEADNWVLDYKSISRERFDTEMVFCLMTPQSKARASEAVLKEVNFDLSKITPDIMGRNGVRFKNIKMDNIQKYLDNKIYYELFISNAESFEIRNILYEGVKGFGVKEASHLCRNTGRGNGIAILDRHILNCYIDRYENKWESHELLSSAYLYAKGVFNKELALTEYRYCIIEDCIINYSQELGIPEKYLDMMWWSAKSGEMFK